MPMVGLGGWVRYGIAPAEYFSVRIAGQSGGAREKLTLYSSLTLERSVLNREPEVSINIPVLSWWCARRNRLEFPGTKAIHLFERAKVAMRHR